MEQNFFYFLKIHFFQKEIEFPNCQVINLIGQLGCGKSLTAFLLFAKLKLSGRIVEYVPEYAKKTCMG